MSSCDRQWMGWRGLSGLPGRRVWQDMSRTTALSQKPDQAFPGGKVPFLSCFIGALWQRNMCHIWLQKLISLQNLTAHCTDHLISPFNTITRTLPFQSKSGHSRGDTDRKTPWTQKQWLYVSSSLHLQLQLWTQTGPNIAGEIMFTCWSEGRRSSIVSCLSDCLFVERGRLLLWKPASFLRDWLLKC